MINISLTNFKVFKDTIPFSFAPITLLTGKNNSGKSSVLKALLVLEDYLSSDNHLVIRLDGPNYYKHKINTLSNLYSWGSSKKAFQLSFTSNSNNEFTFNFEGEPEDNYAFLKTFSWRQDNNLLKIEPLKDGSFNIEISKGFFTQLSRVTRSNAEEITRLQEFVESIQKSIKQIEAQLSGLTSNSENYNELISLRQSEGNRLRLQRSRLKQLSGDMPFPEKALNEHISLDEETPSDIGRINQLIRYILRSLQDQGKVVFNDKNRTLQFRYQDILNQAFSLNVYHLSANRNIQERIFVSGQANQEIFNLINVFQKTQNIKGSQSRVFTEKWLKSFDLGTDVKANPYEGGIAKAVEIKRDGKWRNIADLGFGAGQLLTVILKIASLLEQPPSRRLIHFLRNEDNVLLIEEPEANLHPDFQSKLSQMFADAIGRAKAYHGRLTILLETHSEYLIRSLQLLSVKEEKEIDYQLRKEDVQIFYLDQNQVDYISINLDGSLTQSFGNGFTDVADKTALELFKIQRNLPKK